MSTAVNPAATEAGSEPLSASPWTPEEFLEAVDGIASAALRAAATLRLADHIAAGHTDLESLAERCGADAGALARLLRFLVCRGVFTEPAPRRYELTELSVLLLDGHPGSLRAWLDADGIGVRLDAAVHALPAAVRSGRALYPALFGSDFYADLAASAQHGGSKDWGSFDRLRSRYAISFADQLADVLPLAGSEVVLDVGGGGGVLLERLLHRHRRLTGGVVDLPAAVAAAIDRLASSGVAPDRYRWCTAGSFFEPLPAGVDACLLVDVLHNWDDADALLILQRCRDAVAPVGAVHVVEHQLGSTDGRTATAMDLRMLVLCGGEQRSPGDLHRLARAAGLVRVDDTGLADGRHVTTFRERR